MAELVSALIEAVKNEWQIGAFIFLFVELVLGFFFLVFDAGTGSTKGNGAKINRKQRLSICAAVGICAFLLSVVGASTIRWVEKFTGTVVTALETSASQRPLLIAEIADVVTGLEVLEGRTNGVGVGLFVRVVNRGAPSVAWRWRLKVEVPEQAPHFAQALERRTETTFRRDGGDPIVASADSYLPNSLHETPLATGAGKAGYVTFVLTNCALHEVRNLGTRYILTFEDAFGGVVSASATQSNRGYTAPRGDAR